MCKLDRVLIEVFFPGIGRQYDFWVPQKMTIKVLTEKLSLEISAFENNPVILERMDLRLLYSKVKTTILNPDDTVLSAGIRSGDAFVLL